MCLHRPSHSPGYELSKEDHILALKEDETLLNEALKSHSVDL